MSKFDRYVLSQLLVLFWFFSLVLVAIYWINQAVRVFDQLISDGQTAGAVMAFTALTLPRVIASVMPISAFAASVYVTNRLNSESELVVVQATGFSPFRLAVPYLTFGVFVAILTSVLFHVLVPAANREADRQRAELANNMTSRFLSPGEFLHPTKGVTFYIGEMTPAGVLRSVFLTDARDAEFQTTYVAREAFLLADNTGPKLVMLDGMAQSISAVGQRLSVTRFDEFSYDIGRLISAVRPPQPNPRQLSSIDLLRAGPALIEVVNSTPEAFSWELHSRISSSLLAVTVALIGFTTLLIGSNSRLGVWPQILAAIGLMIVVKMIDNSGSALALSTGIGRPFQYLSLAVSAAICWALLVYAGRDRPVRKTGPPEAAT